MFKQEKNVFHVKTKRKLRFYYSTVKFREKRAECQLVASVILLSRGLSVTLLNLKRDSSSH